MSSRLKAAALHPDDVETGQPGAVAHDLAIGDHVALDPGHAADHRMAADPHKLVDRAQPAEKGVFLDDDMSGQGRVVGHDHMVGDLAVMRDMGADHKQAVVADPGNHAAAGRPGVHCHVFADDVAAADDERGFFAAVFEVLRLLPDRGEREYPGAAPIVVRPSMTTCARKLTPAPSSTCSPTMQ